MGGRNWTKVVKSHELPVIRSIGPGGVIQSVETVVSTAEGHNRKVRERISRVLITRKKKKAHFFLFFFFVSMGDDGCQLNSLW